MNAGRQQQKGLVDGHRLGNILDATVDGVRGAHQQVWHTLAEGNGPSLPEPRHVLEQGLGLGVGFGADHDAAPAGLLARLDRVAVGLGFLAPLGPQQFEKLLVAGHDDRPTLVAGPELGRAQAGGEAAVERDVVLEGTRRDADFAHPHVGIHTLPEAGVNRMLVGVDEVRRREGPELALVGEGLAGQRLDHDFDEFSEVLPVQRIIRGVLGPGPHRLELGPHLEVLHPPGLVAAHQADAEAAFEHVVQGGDLLRRGQRVVGGGDEPAGDDFHPLGVARQPTGHQAGIVGGLEALDLQVVFRMAKAEVATLLGECGVAAELANHALVEDRIAACHASLQLRAPAHCAVNEQPELHGAGIPLVTESTGAALSPRPLALR